MPIEWRNATSCEKCNYVAARLPSATGLIVRDGTPKFYP